MTDRIFLQLFNMSVSAGWLILAVIVLRLFMRKAPRWICCVLWAMVAVRLVCPVSLESVFSLVPSAETINSEMIGSETIRPETDSFSLMPVITSGVPIVDDMLNPIIQNTIALPVNPDVQDAAALPVNPLFIWIHIAGIVWAVGLAVLFGIALLGYLRVRRTLREAVLWGDNIWFCDHVRSPFILGIFRPGIYLPSDIGQEQMDYVLAHEQAHLKRKDHIWKALGYLLLAVYWFNPLVWAAYILLCRDIEAACDEKVIRNLDIGARKAYSRALLSCSLQRRMVMVYPLAFGEVGVKERVRSVLRYKKPGLWVATAAIVACAVVAVCFLTNPEQQAEATSVQPIDLDEAGLGGAVISEPEIEGTPWVENADHPGTDADNPEPEHTASPRVSTGYPGYDALIAEAQDVLENFDILTDEIGSHFSWVIYENQDYETLGYILRDLDGNGVEELIFGENGENGWDGIVYDLYTIADGEVVHIFDGWARNRYYLCENGCIANESSGGAAYSTYAYYTYEGTELTLVEAVIYHEEMTFYSTEYTTYEEVAAPGAYREMIEVDPVDIKAKYVYEHPQFTPFVEP